MTKKRVARRRVAALATPVVPAAPASLPEGSDYPKAIYHSWSRWITAGFQRYPRGTIAALLIGWTGMVFALWGAAIGFLGGLFAFLIVSVFHLAAPGAVLGQVPAPLQIFGGVVAGSFFAIFAFTIAYGAATFSNFGDTTLAIILGAIVAVFLVAVYGRFEQAILNLQGYRRLSDDEVRRLAPLIQTAADKLNLGTLPTFAISDDIGPPRAAAATRTIMFNKGLIDTLTDSEIQGVLAHELAHWKSSDVVGKLFVWAAGWPIILVYNLGRWMAGTGASQQTGASGGGGGSANRGIIGVIGNLLAWPAFFLINFVIIPVIAVESRRSELQADAAVKAAGMGPQLSSALQKLSIFEPGRTGWEQRLAKTHPPTALRLEALQPDRADVTDFRQNTLGAGDVAWLRGVVVDWVGTVAAAGFVVVALVYALGHLPGGLTDRLPFAASLPWRDQAAVTASHGSVPQNGAPQGNNQSLGVPSATRGQPDTQAGATGAAIRFDQAIFAAKWSKPDYTAVVSSNGAPGSLTTVQQEVDTSFTIDFGNIGVPPDTVTPLAYQDDSYGPDKATVQVWLRDDVTQFGQVQQNWYTLTATLNWVDGAWRVSDFGYKLGPSAALVAGVPTGFTPL